MEIQTKIKAPKNLYNSFGKYKYRNAEGNSNEQRNIRTYYRQKEVKLSKLVDGFTLRLPQHSETQKH